jgi:hypothetical protein
MSANSGAGWLAVTVAVAVVAVAEVETPTIASAIITREAMMAYIFLIMVLPSLKGVDVVRRTAPRKVVDPHEGATFC